MDPQGNATVGSGLAMRDLEQGVYEVLLGDISMAQGIIDTGVGYDMLPAHPDLSGAQVEMGELEEKDFRLARALARPDLDVIFHPTIY